MNPNINDCIKVNRPRRILADPTHPDYQKYVLANGTTDPNTFRSFYNQPDMRDFSYSLDRHAQYLKHHPMKGKLKPDPFVFDSFTGRIVEMYTPERDALASFKGEKPSIEEKFEDVLKQTQGLYDKQDIERKVKEIEDKFKNVNLPNKQAIIDQLVKEYVVNKFKKDLLETNQDLMQTLREGSREQSTAFQRLEEQISQLMAKQIGNLFLDDNDGDSVMRDAEEILREAEEKKEEKKEQLVGEETKEDLGASAGAGAGANNNEILQILSDMFEKYKSFYNTILGKTVLDTTTFKKPQRKGSIISQIRNHLDLYKRYPLPRISPNLFKDDKEETILTLNDQINDLNSTIKILNVYSNYQLFVDISGEFDEIKLIYNQELARSKKRLALPKAPVGKIKLPTGKIEKTIKKSKKGKKEKRGKRN